nr:MAG TPA: hypothetical protein [Caudoviricetes sp.]
MLSHLILSYERRLSLYLCINNYNVKIYFVFYFCIIIFIQSGIFPLRLRL